MHTHIHQFISAQAQQRPDDTALEFKQAQLSYAELDQLLVQFVGVLQQLNVQPRDRVAVYLPKQFEAVVSLFGASAARAVFVPVNAQLKPAQVGHILRDCNVRVLVTANARHNSLLDELAQSTDLENVILVDAHKPKPDTATPHYEISDYKTLMAAQLGYYCDTNKTDGIDTDLAAILYTSGSTGRPKGVMLSHRNMRCGALSVAEYLENTASDRILAVLPLSFDYGLSQLTTAFSVGATAILMDYLLPRDVIKAVEKYQITGLAGVPPLWFQLAKLEWPEGSQRLRYFTNSGGAMPVATLKQLQSVQPNAKPYLMYGLTEAFRSSYLDPQQVAQRPESMGKAIPNAELLVLREDGTECDPEEHGELVHRGNLVALGYWNDPEKTAQRFKPLPQPAEGAVLPELAVFSGDTVRRDTEGYLYFVGRRDEMIKCSGYRVSPTEVEEAIFATKLVDEAVALGIKHPELGQAIVIVAQAKPDFDTDALQAELRRKLPNYMLPSKVIVADELPRNPNGKIDRKQLASTYQDLFSA